MQDLPLNSYAYKKIIALQKIIKERDERERIERGLIDKKIRYRIEYDNLFKRIQESQKNSPEHMRLLGIERKLHSRTARFIKHNATFFSDRRKKLFDEIEHKGWFGDRPNFEIRREYDNNS